MTLQGFSSRSKQGLYRSLQAFGQGTPPSRLLYGLTVGNDVVYVCDYLNHKILSYQLDGTKIAEWGTFGTTDGLIDRPMIVKWYNSEVYVKDYTNRVQVFSESGTWARTILTSVYLFDVYDGNIFSVSLSGSTPTFKKTDTSGVLDSSFVFTNTLGMSFNYETGVLNVLSYETGLTLKFYILADDGTITTEINVDTSYPSNEAIAFGPIGIDDTYIYTKDTFDLLKHTRGGTFSNSASQGLVSGAQIYDMDYYDSALYMTVNYSDPSTNPKVRIHSASTLAFDTEWTAT
jgi:hypothetical protein